MVNCPVRRAPPFKMVVRVVVISLLFLQISQAVFFGTPVSGSAELRLTTQMLIISELHLQQRLSVRGLQKDSVSGQSVHLLFRRHPSLHRTGQMSQQVKLLL